MDSFSTVSPYFSWLGQSAYALNISSHIHPESTIGRLCLAILKAKGKGIRQRVKSFSTDSCIGVKVYKKMRKINVQRISLAGREENTMLW